VVAVFAAGRGDDLSEVPGCEPDVVLLTGGTDDGTANRSWPVPVQLADVWQGPVVVAGNVDAQADVAEILAHHPLVVAPNIVPRIGVLAPRVRAPRSASCSSPMSSAAST
jgi:hypothetical protein